MSTYTCKTMLKSHSLHGLPHVVGQINQFRLHSSDSGTVHPYIKQLQTSYVGCAYPSTVNAEVLPTF